MTDQVQSEGVEDGQSVGPAASIEDSDAVQNWGSWLAILGVAGAIGSFFFPVGVETAGLYGIPDEVANIDKIALRHMCMAGSVGLFVGGSALIGAGHVAKAIRVAASRVRPS